MAYQNIGAGNKDDAFYRYKMPKLITKIEGRGNGIKTNLVNMVDVAKALARPASYTTKYFGCELGAQSKFDEKTGTSLVNGAHDSAKLAGLLENFIKKYVQCYECRNPETEIVITKSQNINLKCAACGFVSDVDMMDKVTAFMVKNPPEQKKGGKDKKAMRRAEKERLKAGEALDEDKKKSRKDAKKRGNDGAKSAKKKSGSDEDNSPLGSQKDENEDVEEEDDDNVEWQTDTSIEATKQRIKEQLSTVTSEMVMLDHHEEDIKVKSKHSASKKESAVVKQSNGGIDSAEVGQTLNGIKSMDIHDDLFSVFKEHISKGESPQQLQSFMQSLDASPQDIMTSYFGALFEGAVKGFGAAVAKKRKYLATVVHDENSQGTLLKAIEEFCDTARAEAVKEAGIVLKGLYGADILEEDVIIQWYNKGCSSGSNPIWKSVKPLVEWLQTAESESEEE